MTKVPGSAEVQEILAKYREGTMSLDEVAKRTCDIVYPLQPWWVGWRGTLIALIVLGFCLAWAYSLIWGS